MFKLQIHTRRRRQAKLRQSRAVQLRRRFHVEALERRLYLSGTGTDDGVTADFAVEGGLIELPTTAVNIINSAGNSGNQHVLPVFDDIAIGEVTVPKTIHVAGSQANEASWTFQFNGASYPGGGQGSLPTSLGVLGNTFLFSVEADGKLHAILQNDTDGGGGSLDASLQPAQPHDDGPDSSSVIDPPGRLGTGFPIITDIDSEPIYALPKIGVAGIDGVDGGRQPDVFVIGDINNLNDVVGLSANPAHDIIGDVNHFKNDVADDTDPFPIEPSVPPIGRLPAPNFGELNTLAVSRESANAPAEEGMIDVAMVLHDVSSSRAPIVQSTGLADGSGSAQRPLAGSKFQPPVSSAPQNVPTTATPQPTATYKMYGTRGRSQAFELATLGPADSHRAESQQPSVPASFDLSAVQDPLDRSYADAEIWAMAASNADRSAGRATAEHLPVDNPALVGTPLTAVDAAFKQLGAADDSWFANVDLKQAVPLFVTLIAATGFLIVRPAWGVPDGRDRLVPKPQPLDWASA